MKRGFALVVAASMLAACRGSAPSSAPGGESSGAATVVAAPLDTSWERESGHLLAQGEAAPDFEGVAHTGMRVKLSKLGDRPVVVYFYSTDRSPESEREARGFRDSWMKLRDHVAMVVGVSRDDRITHADFATREELPFLLVADEAGKIAKAFGVAPGTSAAFIVGKDEKVQRVFSGSPDAPFASVVLEALEARG
jgi:peroxiredoxin Q/BCP